MPSRWWAAVGVAIALVVTTVSVANAAPPLPIDSGVWLDPTSPREGERVSGTRIVSGRARLPEGITRVELHVVPAGSTVTSTPVSSAAVTPLGLGEVTFRFKWVVRAESVAVDLSVVATGLLRSVRADVTGVLVGPAPSRLTAHTPVVVSVPEAARLPVTPRGAGPSTPGFRDGVYLGGYGALAYPVLRGSSATGRAAVAGNDVGIPSDGPWRGVAAGLLLMLTATHVHRALRLSPAPSEGSL